MRIMFMTYGLHGLTLLPTCMRSLERGREARSPSWHFCHCQPPPPSNGSAPARTRGICREATNICSVPSSRTFPRSLSQTLARQARLPLVRNPFRHIMSQKTSSFALAVRLARNHLYALLKLSIEDVTFPYSFRLITGIRTISCPIDRDSFTGEWRKRPRGPRRGQARTRRLRQRRLRGRWRR